MRTVISVENLSKRYMIGQQERYQSLRDVLTNSVKNAFKSGSSNFREQEFWALKDLNFEIKQGDRVGIIGRNGAGKSTLLKILSRITESTTGTVKLKGRVASLLEIGTGFHPELTGRENIYLNGAIMGMSKVEIKQKFDEIVAFAEIEQFLDTPVKRYSSGMYVRLAFSVAAHLEPEILIVDEVLAVGDAAFQKKCLGKMERVGGEGRTVIFVSHNMNSIEHLCNKGLLLNTGKLDAMGEAREIIKQYTYSVEGNNQATSWNKASDSLVSNEWFDVESLRLCNSNGQTIEGPIGNDQELFIELKAKVQSLDPALTMGYALYNENNECLYWSYQTDAEETSWPQIKLGQNKLVSMLPSRLLNEGKYHIEAIGGLHFRKWLYEPGKAEPRVNFTIQGGLSESPLYQDRRNTLLAPILKWENHV